MNMTNDPLSALPPGTSAASLGQTFGGGLIGGFITTALFGISCSQVLNYFHNYSNDAKWLKCVVILLLFLGTLHTALCCGVIYHYLVSSAFNLQEIVKNYWGVNVSIALRLGITLVYTVYFIRLTSQLVSPKWKYSISAAIALPSFAHIGIGIATVVHLYQRRYLTQLTGFSDSLILPMVLSQVIADLVLSIVLCVLLNKHKTAFKRTRTMISSLVALTLGRGILTVTGALVILLAVVADPANMWYMAVEFIEGGLYVNSLLFTLNARNKIRAGLMPTKVSFAVPLNYLVVEDHPRRNLGGIFAREDAALPAQRDIPTGTFQSEDSVIDIKFVAGNAQRFDA